MRYGTRRGQVLVPWIVKYRLIHLVGSECDGASSPVHCLRMQPSEEDLSLEDCSTTWRAVLLASNRVYTCPILPRNSIRLSPKFPSTRSLVPHVASHWTVDVRCCERQTTNYYQSSSRLCQGQYAGHTALTELERSCVASATGRSFRVSSSQHLGPEASVNSTE